ncbi:precorrin-6A synthase (deacetylating) [Blastochloris viridis]|uniref:Precorrin-6A synthase [deacetylating] n=1 Tax=Blastochloris viridis TaxID=1079 RepID=A0A0H5B7N6_BLAVI|nr:precorrin-6A synthase (deacetylating) [Blastochloris viridis]ALK08526.1 precorrin 6A synthase [Blastochloris viridis]BAR98187.1 precorrin-6A synthase [Blastochloris viridis]CUU41188.1 precorrin 6A synthase [Blastochloris viridis]
MKTILLIGIGAGNPAQLTVEAIDALNAADVFFVVDKGARTSDLIRLREEICARFITAPRYRVASIPDPKRDRAPADYLAAVETWHHERAVAYETAITDELKDGETGAFLVWGDPALYDSTIRILDQVLARGVVAFRYRVIPGISAVQALAAAHRIPLNSIGGAVHVTTGRRLAEAVPTEADTIVVMLDDGQGLAGFPRDEFDIYWGAYLGTADEVLIAGPASDVVEDILRLRRDRRAAKGWIMDIFLLRRHEIP